MTKQKYIGIENELKSFEKLGSASFDTRDFDYLLNGEYLKKLDRSRIRSDTGNDYYVDWNEIEIVTPPIPLNTGFASRVTNQLIIGRNYVIANTPYLKHTGYSMHWNLTSKGNKREFYRDIAIPFQLFGLTPLSCGFNVKSKSNNTRFEIAGDSLTNEAQINATALLLGAYTMAKSKNNFPLIMQEVEVKKSNLRNESRIYHMLLDGRHTMINVLERSKFCSQNYKETQAQNVLELFYEWLSPFVYKLGEREEISNLEAFIKGEKKLEIDDVKYFEMIKQNDENFDRVYKPLIIPTINGTRSPILQVTNQPEVSLEGKLLKNIVNKKELNISSVNWNEILFENNSHDAIVGIEKIYRFMEEVSHLQYHGTKNVSAVHPNNIINKLLDTKLDRKIFYDPDKDNSAIIEDETEVIITTQ